MVSLDKGGRINLNKVSTSKVFRVGLSWDPAAQAGKQFDLDAVVILADANGKAVKNDYVIVPVGSGIYYPQGVKEAGWILHSGDNRTGEGNGEDESIVVHTDKVPADVHQIIIIVNIYDATNRGQNFGQVRNSKVTLYDSADGNNGVATYDLEEDASMSRAIVFCRLYRHDGEWKFQAVNESLGNKDVLFCNILRDRYGLDIEPSDK